MDHGRAVVSFARTSPRPAGVAVHTWEPVNSETDRLVVPGGWLYRVETRTYVNRPTPDGLYLEIVNVSVVFVSSAPESEEENS